jgi:hypothetical protein
VLVVGAAEDLEDLAGPMGLAEAMSVDDEQVARLCVSSMCHLDPPSFAFTIRVRGYGGIGAATDCASALSRDFVEPVALSSACTAPAV